MDADKNSNDSSEASTAALHAVIASFGILSVEHMFTVARLANCAVYERAGPIAEKIAKRYAKKYDWISVEDLTQNMLFDIPAIMYAYRADNAAKNPWGKYLYYKLYFLAKDYLRKEDPVGIKWPQKKAYPRWHRLGDESLDGFEVMDWRTWIFDEDKNELNQLLDDIAAWREYFSQLPQAQFSQQPADKKRGVKHWDVKRSRVKFRRNRDTLTVLAWYLARKQPKQLALGF